MKLRVIHLGNAGKGATECGAPAKQTSDGHGGFRRNWSWFIRNVTCKRCIAARERAQKEGA